MSRSRDWRRAQQARRIQRFRNIMLHIWNDDGSDWRGGFDKASKIMAENMPICSNPVCCGNPRKLGHKTRQEILAEEELT